MDFTPAEFPTTGVSEKEFIDKMIALAKAGEDEMEHLNAAEIAEKDAFIKSLTCIL